ncbi:AlkA N-terminal domain-containing protein [Thaumasiovibrio sp. DFM-14]|uniref:AlkA N-terminal domain-containing protein n=1 Tax=Thaumasiovibrio sp. DFM-14 TaxID=3384792 RepID=UPI0039A1581B
MNRQPFTSTFFLTYHPPYDWTSIRDFYQHRAIDGLEWVDDNAYGRTFNCDNHIGEFTATHQPEKNGFDVVIKASSSHNLALVVKNIQRCLDLETDIINAEAALSQAIQAPIELNGMRLPGIWSPYEAGIRAIVGQQVSIKAARNLTEKIIASHPRNTEERRYFPTPSQVNEALINTLGMPQRRKETLLEFTRYAQKNSLIDSDYLINIRGIGPWTINYLKLRGDSNPDIYLSGDLGVKKALSKLPDFDKFNPDLASPWRSYLTLYLWRLLD